MSLLVTRLFVLYYHRKQNTISLTGEIPWGFSYALKGGKLCAAQSEATLFTPRLSPPYGQTILPRTRSLAPKTV